MAKSNFQSYDVENKVKDQSFYLTKDKNCDDKSPKKPISANICYNLVDDLNGSQDLSPQSISLDVDIVTSSTKLPPEQMSQKSQFIFTGNHNGMIQNDLDCLPKNDQDPLLLDTVDDLLQNDKHILNKSEIITLWNQRESSPILTTFNDKYSNKSKIITRKNHNELDIILKKWQTVPIHLETKVINPPLHNYYECQFQKNNFSPQHTRLYHDAEDGEPEISEDIKKYDDNIQGEDYMLGVFAKPNKNDDEGFISKQNQIKRQNGSHDYKATKKKDTKCDSSSSRLDLKRSKKLSLSQCYRQTKVPQYYGNHRNRHSFIDEELSIKEDSNINKENVIFLKMDHGYNNIRKALQFNYSDKMLDILNFEKNKINSDKEGANIASVNTYDDKVKEEAINQSSYSVRKDNQCTNCPNKFEFDNREDEKVKRSAYQETRIALAVMDPNDSFDVPPMKTLPKYKFIDEDRIRKNSQKAKFNSYACNECKEYYQFKVNNNNDVIVHDEFHDQIAYQYENFENFLKKNGCKHRSRYLAPSTPEHFWSIGMPSTQECKKRG
ncbi:unnamed protein product [Gordionus sp. m RMFG-2023]